MKYLLQAISSRRTDVHLTDPDLRQLLTEVRKGRDEREEFLESIERIITDLRGYNEHSAPFLARVSKRDAPDYYDFIKTPMDLGTMSKKLRAGQYRNKRQFADDLDLIWENCLVYNSDPSHPLRRNVQFMRKKANHLLEFVSDKSDVKDALSQWEAAEEAAAAAATANGATAGTPTTFSSPNLAGLTPFSRRPTSLTISLGRKAKRRTYGSSEQDGDAEGDGDGDAGLPFDQRPALIRTPANMQTFSSLDNALAASWQEMSLSVLEGDLNGVSESSAGPSQARRLELNGVQASEVPGTLRTLSTFAAADPVRTALTAPTSALPATTPSTPAPPNVAFLEVRRPTGSAGEDTSPNPLNWWAALSHESLAANGLPALPHSRTNPVQSSKRRRVGTTATATATAKAATAVDDNSTLTAKPIPTGPFAPAEPRSNGTSLRGPDLPPRLRKARAKAGYAGLVTENVRTVRRLRKTHVKFVELAHATSALQNGDESMMQTIRAAIAESDSDSAKGEDEDETLLQDGNAGRRRQRRRERIPRYWPLGGDAGDPEELEEVRESENPFVHLDPQDVNAASSHVVNVLLAHSGFEASHASPASVLTSILAETLMNLGRTLRLYSDQYAQQMSPEEMVLHALRENGNVGVAELETHVRDDVERYGVKMADLLRKMKGAYADEVQNQMERAAEEDEAGFVDGSEAFLSGAFASDMGDDFFGFKEMGLEADLGVGSLSVPARLLAGGRRAFAGGAANGMRPGGATSDEPSLQYPPPAPFVPISSGSIACQIGLLQPWYRDKMRVRRARFRRAALVDGVGVGGGEGAVPHTNGGEADTQAEQAHREALEATLELEDEEQERQKYRVPPNGKMPVRPLYGVEVGSAAGVGVGKAPLAAAAAAAAPAGVGTGKVAGAGAGAVGREGTTAGTTGRGRGRGRGGGTAQSKKQRRESVVGGGGAARGGGGGGGAGT